MRRCCDWDCAQKTEHTGRIRTCNPRFRRNLFKGSRAATLFWSRISLAGHLIFLHQSFGNYIKLLGHIVRWHGGGTLKPPLSWSKRNLVYARLLLAHFFAYEIFEFYGWLSFDVSTSTTRSSPPEKTGQPSRLRFGPFEIRSSCLLPFE